MLQQLAGYAAAHLGDSEPGFKSREVRWCIEINSAGTRLGQTRHEVESLANQLSRLPHLIDLRACLDHDHPFPEATFSAANLSIAMKTWSMDCSPFNRTSNPRPS